MRADSSFPLPHTGDPTPTGPFSPDSGAGPGAAPLFPSDEQVLRDMAAGHEGALLELHRRYARALYGLGRRILASPEAVQRGVEDALMIAWHHAARYEPAQASVHGWLIGIAHHCFLQLRRGVGGGGGGGTLRLHDQFRRLDTPGDPDLHLLALAYYCGESPARLSETSGLPQPAVEQALLSALDRLPGLAQQFLSPAGPLANGLSSESPVLDSLNPDDRIPDDRIADGPIPDGPVPDRLNPDGPMSDPGGRGARPEAARPEAAGPEVAGPEADFFPTLSSLAATAPVTRVEPWEPPRSKSGPSSEAEHPQSTHPQEQETQAWAAQLQKEPTPATPEAFPELPELPEPMEPTEPTDEAPIPALEVRL